jgi:hypothetical protein
LILQALPFAASGKPDPNEPRPKKPAPDENERRDDPAKSRKKDLDHELDEELDESFPASDPPSVTQEPH